jgi:hypothetical protein
VQNYPVTEYSGGTVFQCSGTCSMFGIADKFCLYSATELWSATYLLTAQRHGDSREEFREPPIRSTSSPPDEFRSRGTALVMKRALHVFPHPSLIPFNRAKCGGVQNYPVVEHRPGLEAATAQDIPDRSRSFSNDTRTPLLELTENATDTRSISATTSVRGLFCPPAAATLCAGLHSCSCRTVTS